MEAGFLHGAGCWVDGRGKSVKIPRLIRGKTNGDGVDPDLAAPAVIGIHDNLDDSRSCGRGGNIQTTEFIELVGTEICYVGKSLSAAGNQVVGAYRPCRESGNVVKIDRSLHERTSETVNN